MTSFACQSHFAENISPYASGIRTATIRIYDYNTDLPISDSINISNIQPNESYQNLGSFVVDTDKIRIAITTSCCGSTNGLPPIQLFPGQTTLFRDLQTADNQDC
jgi:hypothetical protein